MTRARDAADQINRVNSSAADATAITIDSSENVGIGTTSPTRDLHINGTAASAKAFTRYTHDGLASTGLDVGYSSGGYASIYNAENTAMVFSTNATERMRTNSNGSLLIGQSLNDRPAEFTQPTGASIAGATGHLHGQYQSSVSGLTMLLNRKGSDGQIIGFRKDGADVGSIGSKTGDIYIGNGQNVGLMFEQTGSDRIEPCFGTTGALRDNAIGLGGASSRFNVVYAATGSINTSDRNEKQDIDVMSEAETRVAVACKGLIRKFRWIDAVAKKGDDARIHFGIIAQDLQDAFAAEGLDASRYAMFCSDTWWEAQTDIPAVEAVDEVLDEDGNVVTEAVEAKDAYTRTDTYETLEEAPEGATERTRLGVRYSELLAFIIGAM